MAGKKSWDEIKATYPDEWVILVDLDVNDTTDVTAGRVYNHSPDKDYIHEQQLLVRENTAVLYTGKLHGAVASRGLARVEIEDLVVPER